MPALKTMKKEDDCKESVIHDCGHDEYVTWMPGIAKIMIAQKNEWQGTLRLIAQPLEEPMPRAGAMAKDKMYKKEVSLSCLTKYLKLVTLLNNFLFLKATASSFLSHPYNSLPYL
jgi:hypothetical protein